GRIAGADVATDRPSPPFDASAMDGYAVHLGSLRAGIQQIAGEVRIGTDPGVLDVSRGVMRIVTGGALPRGADAVIKREDVEEIDVATIKIAQDVIDRCRVGLAVRPRGENGAAGTMLGLAGSEINAPAAGALASAGASVVTTHSPVRVAILTTGDELVGTDEVPGPYQLRDSNGPALAAMLSRRRWLAASTPRRVRDEPEVAFALAAELLANHDCLLLTGGVSMGHRDFVPALVESLGGQKICHHLPQRPGKPLLLAAAGGKLIAGLPGNPQSVMVTARRIVVPILAHVAGMHEAMPVPRVQLQGDDASLGLWWYRPARLGIDGGAVLVDGRGSGDIIAASRSDGFVELTPNQKATGMMALPFYSWSW
ncbi:MAG: molybdopterin molybdotransferase MoeA, partial [Planctomycetota bacterium]|nr:molybdopterin molybdotransferase MoeA [Planctomycetota bacterium]